MSTVQQTYNKNENKTFCELHPYYEIWLGICICCANNELYNKKCDIHQTIGPCSICFVDEKLKNIKYYSSSLLTNSIVVPKKNGLLNWMFKL
jgi:hypothetical protein